MLYEKTLSRKVVSVSSKPEEDGNTTNGAKHGPLSRWQQVVNFFKTWFRSKKEVVVVESAPEKSPELASMGKIMNLMR